MGASSGAIRAGAAFVELFANDSKLVQGLSVAEARVRKFSAMMAKAGVAMAASAGAIATPLGAALKGAIDQGADTLTLAKNLGTTTEKLTAFGYAASTVGVPFDKLSGYLDGLPAKLSELADGAGSGAELLRRLGIPARQLINMDFEDRMAALADAVKGVASPIDRARVATELFGDAGKDLLPLLEQGGAAYRELATEAKRTGQVLPTVDAMKATQAARSLVQVTEAGKNAFLRIGAALVPTVDRIKDLTARFLSATSGIRYFASRNKELIQIVFGVAAAIAAAGAALAVVGVAVPAILSGIGAVLAPLVKFGLLLYAIPAPILIAVAAVTALVAAFLTLTDVGQEIAGSVGGYFSEMGETFNEAWGGIAAALKNGDLPNAAAVAMAALDVEFKRGLLKLQEAWVEFKRFFVDGWHDGVMLVELALEDAQHSIAKTLVDLLQFVANQFTKTFDTIIDGAARIADALGQSGLAGELRAIGEMVKLDTTGIQSALDDMNKSAKSDIFKGRQNQQDESDRSRNADLDAARTALATAQAAFADSIGVVAKIAEDKTKAAVGNGKDNGGIAAKTLPTLQRGTFSAPSFGQFFSAPGLQNRQLTEAVKTNVKLDEVKKAIQDGSVRPESAAVFK